MYDNYQKYIKNSAVVQKQLSYEIISQHERSGQVES